MESRLRLFELRDDDVSVPFFQPCGECGIRRLDEMDFDVGVRAVKERDQARHPVAAA